MIKNLIYHQIIQIFFFIEAMSLDKNQKARIDLAFIDDSIFLKSL